MRIRAAFVRQVTSKFRSHCKRELGLHFLLHAVSHVTETEAVEELIEDPWLTIPCPAGSEVCEVEFEDP